MECGRMYAGVRDGMLGAAEAEDARRRVLADLDTLRRAMLGVAALLPGYDSSLMETAAGFLAQAGNLLVIGHPKTVPNPVEAQ